MSISKAWARAGAFCSFALLLFIIFKQDSFAAQQEWGNVLLLISLGAGLLTLPAVAIKFEKPAWLRCIYMLLLFAVVPAVMLVAVERLNGNFLTDFLSGWEDFWANYVVYVLLYLLVYGLSGSVRGAILTVSPILLLFGIANMYVKEFKGGPLVPMDFAAIKTAGNVAAGYTYEIGYEMVFAISLTVLVMALACRLKMPRPRWWLRAIPRAFGLVVVAGFAWVFFCTDTVADYGLKPDFFNQTRGYEHHGAVLEFTLNTKYLKLMEPSGYDAEQIQGIVDENTGDEVPHILETALLRQGATEEEAAQAVDVETAGEQGITPNIIVIMDEAFSDLSVVGDFETNQDYLPFINSIKGETIQGNAYVSTIGTGTSNTEFEFLTGNTMAFLPAGSNAYQLYVKGEQPGLTSTLLHLGYSADAFHPYFESSWNRPQVYEYMGFRDFITTEDMFGQDLIDEYVSSGYSFNTYRRLLREKFPGEDILLRRFVSDEYDFNKLIEMYENKGDEPFYVFNVTMQSHSSYDTKYSNFRQQIELTSTSKEYPKTNQYLSLLKETDTAFENLVRYFETVEEPTIILLYGDHQPYIENGFYSEVMGQSISDMDDETQQKRYITRFVLWANYDIPTGWIDEISMNYLSTLLLQVSGLPMTDYNRYLANLYTKLPVITAMGCRDSQGNFFQADESNPLEREIADYRKVQYNNLADLKHRATSVFYLREAGQ